MMRFLILIQLFWYDPIHNDKQDLQITHKDGQLLVFKTQTECFLHVAENFDELQKFTNEYYKNKATVKQILCVLK